MTCTRSAPAIATGSGPRPATARRASLALLLAALAAAGTTRLAATTPRDGRARDGRARPAPHAGHYVAPSGRSGNAGTAASPWDLATALAGAGGRIGPGDTVWIRGGTYPGGGSLTVNGSSAGQVVFSGYPGETAIVRRQFRSTGDYVTIQRLVFEGPIDRKTNQVYLHDCHHVVFTRNEIRDGDYHAGLSVDESNHVTITYNYIHDNGRDPSHDHGIYFKTTTGGGTVIANNLLVRNAARGLSLHDNSGVGVFDVLVAHNTVVGNGSTGILVNDGDRMTLVGNVAVDNGDRTRQPQIRVRAGKANRIVSNLTWHATAFARRGIENATPSPMRGNVIADPLFVSRTDFHLRAGSPAIDLGPAGYFAGPDYAGAPRDARPDAGAYEYRP